jgi:regulator of cell morphogenesis and NO signaling
MPALVVPGRCQEEIALSTTVDHAESLGDIIQRLPAAGSVLERLGIDYCCGGGRTLAAAAAEKGLDPATVAVMLEAIEDAAGDGAGGDHPVPSGSLGELSRHIVDAHHEPLRADLPRIGELVATVVRVHGPVDPSLHEVERVFTAMREELVEHMAVEERDLFPLAEALDAPGEGPGTLDPALIALLEDDHDGVGAALRTLRELCGDYRQDAAYCGTHRALLGSLDAIERDLHRHVHEENNVLFPRMRARAGIA